MNDCGGDRGGNREAEVVVPEISAVSGGARDEADGDSGEDGFADERDE